MSESSNSNLIDRPKLGVEEDLLGVNRYINALSKFLSKAAMPTTIAIQGEWGSGKSSVINSLRYSLCDTADEPEEGKPFHSIFLNMWEYSLLNSPEETIESVIRGLLDEVTRFLEHHEQTNGAIETLKKISSSRLFKAALKGGRMASALYPGGEVVGGAIDKLGQMINGEEEAHKEFRPAEFRKAVGSAIDECIQKDHIKGDTAKRGFMIFVDDLDRINPESAVQILEMLKNFFEVNQCIFVLAIDYNVVVKGLKAKLGSKDENDERAYRSFFDKIIQMPFTMPTEKYHVDSYIAASLKQIGYCTDDDLDVKVIDKEGEENDRTFIQAIADITSNSTGSNPRSIKRLLNSLSLLQYMYEEDQAAGTVKNTPALAHVERIINYAFVCMQIAYPEIYRFLVKEPVYTQWTLDTAESFKIKGFQEYYNTWLENIGDDSIKPENILYQAIIKCYCKTASTWLQNRASSIIEILIMIEDLCTLNKKDFVELIPAILDMSSVTAISSDEDKKVKTTISKGGMTLLEFWDQFQNFAMKNEDFANFYNRRKPSSSNWTNYATGDARCNIVLANKLTKNNLTLDVATTSPELYALFEEHKDEIEAVAGPGYEWRPFSMAAARGGKGKTAYIRMIKQFSSTNSDNWPEIFAWATENMIRLRKAIDPFLKSR